MNTTKLRRKNHLHLLQHEALVILQFRLQLILPLAGANFYYLHLRSPERIKELHIYLLA
ncbi:hypothetical protein [Nostoc sp.]